jgi:hypothetical protein
MAIIEFPLPICGAVVLSSSVSYCMSGNNIVIVLDLFFIGSLELFFLNVSWQNLKAHQYCIDFLARVNCHGGILCLLLAW